MTDTSINIFELQKNIESRNINRVDNPGLPDKPGVGRLLVFQASPYVLALQLRTATDRVVQFKSINLDRHEAKKMALDLLELASRLKLEGGRP